MAVALVALSGAGWLLWLAHNPAAVKGVAMTDHPLPATTSREAVAHYGSALSKLRLGTMGSRTEFEKAVALDPTLAAAQLRLALYGFWFGIPAAERRLHLAQASVFAASLEPREKALLPVAEAVASDPIETDIAIARTRAVEERYPEDAEVALYFYILVQSSKPAAEVEAAALRALALDPLETQVLAIQTDDALKDNQLSKASALVDRCLQLAPGAAGCRYRRAVLESEEGRCEALLTDARESVRTQPDVSSSYGLLALALAATHAPAESVGSALEDAESQRVANAHEPGGLARLAFATFTGDLAGADAVAAALMPTVAAAHSERLNGLLALHRIELAEETGGSAKALSIAETFARQASAWTQDGPMGVRAKRLYLLREAGTLDEAAFAAARDTLIDEILKEGDAGGASPWLGVFFPELPSGATGDPTARDAIRLMLDASYAETPAEANAALTTEAQRTLMTRYLSRRAPQLDAWVVGFGHLLALAGRTDDAVPLLERMTRSCEVVGPDVSLADLGASLTYLKAQGFLGEALEAKGDRTGACQAYGVIQARWKDPRPRSVTWEKATARARVLGCPAPTGG